MRLQKHRQEPKSTLSLSVKKIEVTRATWELDEMGVYETYYRTIRFTTVDGEVLDVQCSGAVPEYVKLRSVKKLPAVTTPKPGKPAPADWLQPKVYKGKSMHEEELENQDGWKVYTGELEEEDDYTS
jgi:hypothetical protein